MSNYVVTTNFLAKDSLVSGNPSKAVKGAELTTEFNNIATMSTTKQDTSALNQPNGYLGLNSSGGITLTGAANNYAALFNGSSTSGQSFGVEILAGTTAADQALIISNQANNTTFLAVFGNGEVYVNLNQNGLFAAAAPTGCTPVGYLDTPLVSGGASRTLGFSDRGKFISMLAASTLTIPANASVAFPVGTTILVFNQGASAMSINITTDTLDWVPSGTTGNRTLAGLSVATLYKFSATQWLIWGFGIS